MNSMKEYPSQTHPKAVVGNLYIHDDQKRLRTQLVNGSKGISLAFQVGVLHSSMQNGPLLVANGVIINPQKMAL